MRNKKLLIKCPVCEKEYTYGRKICHICKGNSIFFGKIFENEQKSYKWNCNTAMSYIELIESKRNTLEQFIEKTTDNEILSKKNYDWNCETANKLVKNQINERKINHFSIYE